MNESKPNKKIHSISIKKNKILVWFDDEDSLTLDEATFTDHYLYVGKTLTELEYSQLRSASSLSTLKNYAFGLMQRGFYTEFQLKQKLYKRTQKRHEVEAVLALLKKYKMVDDERWVEEHIQYGHEKKWGYLRILQHCIEKGITETLLKNRVFDDHLEEEKARFHLAKEKQLGLMPFGQKRRKMYDRLVTQGFESSIILKVLESLTTKDLVMEKKAFEKDFQLLHKKYSRTEKGFRLKQKIIQSLLRKGYNYSDISTWLGETYDSMD